LNRARADRLLERLARGGNGQAANDLLREFFYGYPLERLSVLLESDNPEAAKSGAFIASELGDRFAPLFAAVDRMLEHPVKAVRFDALDVVLVNGTPEHGETIAKAVVLVRDPEEASAGRRSASSHEPPRSSSEPACSTSCWQPASLSSLPSRSRRHAARAQPHEKLAHAVAECTKGAMDGYDDNPRKDEFPLTRAQFRVISGRVCETYGDRGWFGHLDPTRKEQIDVFRQAVTELKAEGKLPRSVELTAP